MRHDVAQNLPDVVLLAPSLSKVITRECFWPDALEEEAARVLLAVTSSPRPSLQPCVLKASGSSVR